MTQLADPNADCGKLLQRVRAILDTQFDHISESQLRFFRATSIEAEKFEFLDRDSPILRLVNHIGNYWRHSLLVVIGTETFRPSTLVRLLNAIDPSRPISQRMLCMNLKILQRDGLVARHVVDAKRFHVEYSLTPLGQQLVAQLMPLLDWIMEHAGDVMDARAAFDASEDRDL